MVSSNMNIEFYIRVHRIIPVHLANEADVLLVIFDVVVLVSEVSKGVDNNTEEKIRHDPNDSNMEENIKEEPGHPVASVIAV